MRLRTLTGRLTATAVAITAAVALTACESRAGAAAVVAGHRISASEVNGYVTPGPVPSQSPSPSRPLLRKTTALSYLVQREVFRKVLAANGGVPSQADLGALHDKAAATLLQTSLTGAALDSSLTENVQRSGFEAKFAGLLFETIELEQALIDRTNAQTINDLAAATKKVGVPVSVSRRYGSWDAAQLQITDPTGQTPDFLKLQSSAAAAPQPAG